LEKMTSFVCRMILEERKINSGLCYCQLTPSTPTLRTFQHFLT